MFAEVCQIYVKGNHPNLLSIEYDLHVKLHNMRLYTQGKLMLP